jgi:hypothetical protein
MLSWIARFLFLRFLPRRLVPVLTLIEILRIARSLNRQRRRFAVNDPRAPRAAPPPRPPGSRRS